MIQFFNQGFWHFLQAPSHIVVLFGLGLIIGQQGERAIYAGLSAFAVSVIAGLLLTQLVTITWSPDIVLLGSAIIVGGMLALRLDLPVWSVALLVAVPGLLIGMDSKPVMIPGMKRSMVYAALAGAALSTCFAVWLVALPSLLLRSVLNGIVLRVLGSWVTASALMVLTLMFAPG